MSTEFICAMEPGRSVTELLVQKSGLCPVIVVDVDNMRHAFMKIYDVTEVGCNVIGKRDLIKALSSRVYLVIKDFDRLINGQIVWRENDRAEILFEQKTTSNREKRRESRIDVSFPAIINDVVTNETKDCIVCDASKSGCRVKVDNGFELSDRVVLFVKTFGRKMPGRIVWRTENFVGLQFNWAIKE